jgi:hypothetical protein
MDGECSTHVVARNECKLLVIKTEGKRPLERPRRRWENGTKMSLWEMWWDGTDWIHLAHERDGWWALLETVITSDSIKGVIFLKWTSVSTISFSTTPLHGVTHLLKHWSHKNSAKKNAAFKWIFGHQSDKLFLYSKQMTTFYHYVFLYHLQKENLTEQCTSTGTVFPRKLWIERSFQ